MDAHDLGMESKLNKSRISRSALIWSNRVELAAYTVSMRPHKAEPGDLSGILDRSHENKWVAITSDYSQVIAAADSLRGLFRSVSDSTVIFFKVLPHDVSFAPTVSFGA
jgi:hypothetical protein